MPNCKLEQRLLIACLAGLILAGCASAPDKTAPSPTLNSIVAAAPVCPVCLACNVCSAALPSSPENTTSPLTNTATIPDASRGRLERTQWQALPNWGTDDSSAALTAFLQGCPVLKTQPAWLNACNVADQLKGQPAKAITQFFEAEFEPYQAINANNSETGGALVPLLTLGIPGSGTTAILLAAFILWGLRPGPLMIQENPDLFWGLVASMYVGNVMLLVLNLPLIPLFAQILKLREYILYPIIFGISIIGVYAVSSSLFDCWMLVVFGLLGYAVRRLDYPSAPLILGLVLGDSMERALRQSLMMSQGDLGILVSRPISATMLILAVILLCLPMFRRANAWRVKALEENG